MWHHSVYSVKEKASKKKKKIKEFRSVKIVYSSSASMHLSTQTMEV